MLSRREQIEDQQDFIAWLKANKMYDSHSAHYTMQFGHDVWVKAGKPKADTKVYECYTILHLKELVLDKRYTGDFKGLLEEGYLCSTDKCLGIVDNLLVGQATVNQQDEAIHIIRRIK